jgi:hypothetical protein
VPFALPVRKLSRASRERSISIVLQPAGMATNMEATAPGVEGSPFPRRGRIDASGEEPIQGVRKSLSVRGFQDRGAGGRHPRAPQRVHPVPDGQPLADRLLRVKRSSWVQGERAFFHDSRCQRHVGRDDKIPGPGFPHDGPIGLVQPAGHEERLHIGVLPEAEGAVGHKGQRNAPALGGPQQDFPDVPRAGVRIHPE